MASLGPAAGPVGCAGPVVKRRVIGPDSHLQVEVTGQVDCRGCLNIDHQVRTGFFAMDVQVRLETAPGTDDGLIRLLQELAERLCVNLDTLRHGVPVTVSFQQPSLTR
jgi:hypothetical protein